MPQALTALIDEAMRLERERHLGVGAYERSDERRDYPNGYKPKRVKTRVGALELAVPQVREGGFCPQSLDKGLRLRARPEAGAGARFSPMKKDRGLHGMKLLVSDDRAGLKAATAAVFSAVLPAVPWQRCPFHQLHLRHLQQNAAAYVPRQEMRKTVAADIRAIFNAPDEQEAERLLERFVDKHQAKGTEARRLGR